MPRGVRTGRTKTKVGTAKRKLVGRGKTGVGTRKPTARKQAGTRRAGVAGRDYSPNFRELNTKISAISKRMEHIDETLSALSGRMGSAP